MITTSVPDTWQALEAGVTQILEQCGFVVEHNKRVDAGRGSVDIDVYAVELIDGRRSLILCECKNWSNNIPQNVVHGFRTVVEETGANHGYIIASNGFQAGARAAAARSNVELLTWQEFQIAFERTWADAYLVPKLEEGLDSYFTYTEPLLPPWVGALSQDNLADYMTLFYEHEPTGYLAMQFTTYHRMRRRGAAPIPRLPIRGSLKDETGIPDEILDCPAYSELLNMLLARADRAVAEFRKLRATVVDD